MESNTILVTGAAGYIGSVVCQHLMRAGHDVVGLDNLMYGAQPALHLLSSAHFDLCVADITDHREVERIVAKTRPRAIVHLAAIVGDPASRVHKELTRRVNYDGTRILFEAANREDVQSFIFASTCSNYGLSSSDAPIAETAVLNPLSPYAESKVAAEEWLLAHRVSSTSPTVLRFATAHGLSPRMRFDLTVNEFARAIVRNEALELYDASTYRPYCHVMDFARAIELVIARTPPFAEPKVFNVGSGDQNFTKTRLVELIGRVAGVMPRVHDIGAGKDRRNYQVSFERIQRELRFTACYDVVTTVRQIMRGDSLDLFRVRWEPSYGNV